MRGIHSITRFCGRVVRTGKTIARSDDVPRWLRWLFVFGVMPIPLCLDEIALVVAVGLMLVLYRATLRSAWSESTR